VPLVFKERAAGTHKATGQLPTTDLRCAAASISVMICNTSSRHDHDLSARCRQATLVAWLAPGQGECRLICACLPACLPVATLEDVPIVGTAILY
jgi:hypothetical protein